MGAAQIQGPNLHVPFGDIDSGLDALQLILDVGQNLQVSGWLMAANLLQVMVGGNVTLDVRSRIETRDDNNRLIVDAAGAMSIRGTVTAKGDGGKPELKAGGALSLFEGGIIAAPGPNAVVEVQSDVAVSLNTGTAVLAGVTFDSTNGSQVARVTGANSNVIIRSPGEVFIPASVAASQGIQLFAGAARSDHSDYFKSLVPASHPLYNRSHYSIMISGTLLTFGNNADLVLSAQDDVIVRGNLDLRGNNSNLTVQSDSSVYFEGMADLRSGSVKLYGGISLDGTTDMGGAYTDG
ncbi:MAG: hypothetical protein EBV06_17605, partial [Planctomycetia bacterium]|nr:hypothetical protein [Planctomycetia bacterium]